MIESKKLINEKLTKRAVTTEDLEVINELAKTVHFEVGLNNLKLYFEISPNTWIVAVNEQNEIVAYDTFNRLNVSENVCFGYQLVIRKDYHGKGLVQMLGSQQYAPFGIIGNATQASVTRFPYNKFGDKILGYKGFISNPETINPKNSEGSTIQIVEFNINLLEQLLTYDLSVLGFDRRTFMTEWVSAIKYPCHTTTLCAYKDGRFCGFGTFRECSDYFQICPLYADDDAVVELLLYHLSKRLPNNKELLLWFFAKNRLITKWVNNLKFICTNSETRVYMKTGLKTDLWDTKRVYALHDYYPV